MEGRDVLGNDVAKNDPAGGIDCNDGPSWVAWPGAPDEELKDPETGISSLVGRAHHVSEEDLGVSVRIEDLEKVRERKISPKSCDYGVQLGLSGNQSSRDKGEHLPRRIGYFARRVTDLIRRVFEGTPGGLGRRQELDRVGLDDGH